MLEIITGGAAVLGVIFITTQSFYYYYQIKPKMKPFVSTELKSRYLIGFMLLLFFFLSMAIFSYIISLNIKDDTVKPFFRSISYVMLFLGLVLSILKWIEDLKDPDCYYKIKGKMYRLQLVTDDCIFLVSENKEQQVIIKEKSFLFKNEHKLMTFYEVKRFKKRNKHLF